MGVSLDDEALNTYYFFHLGNISELNRLAREHNAHYIIHTGDFGFYGTGQ